MNLDEIAPICNFVGNVQNSIPMVISTLHIPSLGKPNYPQEEGLRPYSDNCCAWPTLYVRIVAYGSNNFINTRIYSRIFNYENFTFIVD